VVRARGSLNAHVSPDAFLRVLSFGVGLSQRESAQSSKRPNCLQPFGWPESSSQPAAVSGSPIAASARERATAIDSARTYARAAASMMSVETP
jgi:hypothetical protein